MPSRGGLDAGADLLETDLHLAADGVVVCFHDDTLERTTDGVGPVAGLTLAELGRLDAGYRHHANGDFPFRGQAVRVPTLEEVLTTFPHVGVVIDLKQDGLEEPLAALLERLAAWDRVVMGSFLDQRLARLRSVAPSGTLTSAGLWGARLWWAASRLGRPGPPGPTVMQVPESRRGLRVIDRRFVDTCHRAGLPVHVWTVNQREDMERLWALGVDALITDQVALAAATRDGR